MGERILYVEDEEALAMIGQRRLNALGYDVTIATGYMEALPEEEIRGAGVAKLMKKPLTTGELAEQVRAILAVR